MYDMFLKKYLIFILAVIYILLPVDIVPDAIPFFGTIDDSALVILGLLKQYIDYRREKKNTGV